MKINYILAMYFGERRSYPNNNNKFLFLEQQLKFFSKVPENHEISNVIFSINYDNSVDKDEIEFIINNSNLKIKYEINYRDNVGYSYANWNEVVINNLDSGYDYHFLMEDDYIPVDINFYKPFYKLIKDNIAYACLLESEQGFMGHQRHPTMSVGLLKNEIAKRVFENFGNVLCVSQGQDYSSAEQSQIHMMDYFNELGYDFVGISNNFRKPFWDNSLGLWERGGIDPAIIIPIGVNLN